MIRKRSAPLSEEAIVAFALDLVAIPTENPPGAAYDECVARIAAELEMLAIPYEVIETGNEETPRQTILALAGESGPLLYLHGHYDVVPAFSREQFEPRVADGRLIGRGASDMKGGLAAMVYAARAGAAAGARVGLAIVPDEETGGRWGPSASRNSGESTRRRPARSSPSRPGARSGMPAVVPSRCGSSSVARPPTSGCTTRASTR